MGAELKVFLAGLCYDEEYRHVLSLGYLKAYAEEQPDLQGVRIELSHFAVLDNTELIVERILERGPDVVGFSCYLWSAAKAYELCRELRRRKPGIRLVLGGPDVTAHADRILLEVPADVVVCGEGELTFAELLRRWKEGQPAEGVLGTVQLKDGAVVRTEARPLIEDLSVIPSPYLKGIFQFEVTEREYRVALETARGCPHHCRFCDWGYLQKTRTFPVERVLAEVAHIERQTSVVYFFITDADAFAHPERALRLVKGFDKLTGAQGMHWHFQTNLRHMSEPLAKALNTYKFSLGCGIESIQPKALAKMTRAFDLEKTERALELLRRHAPKCSVHLQFLHGLPDDDLRGYQRTLEWALSQKTDSLFPPRALALPGSDFGRRPELYGITADPRPPHMVLSTSTFPAEDVEKADWLAYWTLNLSLIGPLKAALQFVGGDMRSDDPPNAPATPWIDLQQRLLEHMNVKGEKGFFARLEQWRNAQDPLDRVMKPECLSWWMQPPLERAGVLAQASAWAKKELEAAGRAGEWPVIDHFLKTQEARMVWEKFVFSQAFRRLLQALFGPYSLDNPRLRWLGWELLYHETWVCSRAQFVHVVSTPMYQQYDLCRVYRSLHMHLDDRRSLKAWEKVLRQSRAHGLTVLSNVYHAIPAHLRPAVLRLLRETDEDKAGRLILFVDSAGLSPVECFTREAGEDLGPSTAGLPAETVLRELKEAGWELEGQPRTLTIPAPLAGQVSFTLFVARALDAATLREGASRLLEAGEVVGPGHVLASLGRRPRRARG